jgi:hypothetical protein
MRLCFAAFEVAVALLVACTDDPERPDATPHLRDAGTHQLDPGVDGSASTPSRDAGRGPADGGLRDASPRTDALPPAPGALCTSCGACEESLPVARSEHVPGDVVYPDRPPASGDHNSCWTSYGVHDEPVPDERWVHNLEHGAVVFLYNCPQGCPDQVSQLRKLVADCGSWAILTPYDLMPEGYAAVSWGHRIVSSCVDLQAFAAFYAKNANLAPESNNANPSEACGP